MNTAVFILLMVLGVLALQFIVFGVPMMIKYKIDKSKRKSGVKRWTAKREREFDEAFAEEMRQFFCDAALLRGFPIIIRRRRR